MRIEEEWRAYRSVAKAERISRERAFGYAKGPLANIYKVIPPVAVAEFGAAIVYGASRLIGGQSAEEISRDSSARMEFEKTHK